MDNLRKIFGNNLKILRKSKNITQEKLAELVDIHPQQVSKIETGEYFPSCKTLERIYRELNVHPRELFDFELDSQLNYETDINYMLDRFKKVAKTPERVSFIKMALDALDDESALGKLELLIEGIKISKTK